MKSTVLFASVLLCVLSVSADPAHAQVQSCAGQPNGIPCDTEGDTCTLLGSCLLGNCLGEIPVPNGTGCDDGSFCNGLDTCQTGVCANHAGNPCDGPDGDGNCSESCDEATDSCTAPDPNGSVCDDGNDCTTGDSCDGGSCAVSLGEPNGTPCTSDGTFCNGAEECQSATCVRTRTE